MTSVFRLCITGCFISVLCWSSLDATQLDQKLRFVQPVYDSIGNSVYDISDESASRLRRAISQAAKGAAAARNLLAAAQKVKTKSKNFRAYRKDGNYATVLADFNSVNPVVNKPHRSYINLRGSNKNYPLVGTVGDTRLIVRKNGDHYSKGAPVLEIRPALDPMYTRIVYKTPEN